jgi:cell division protein FtsQ
MRSHELWNAQIQQIYIARNKDVEIVPVVGNHIIVLGSVTDYKRKLWKMEAMYREGFKLADWNAYHKISLKYSNQVICSK